MTFTDTRGYPECRASLASLSAVPSGKAALAILDFMDRSGRTSITLGEANGVTEDDLGVTLAGLCLLSQGSVPLFDAILVFTDEDGVEHEIARLPGEGDTMPHPVTGAPVADVSTRTTFRFDVCGNLLSTGG